jgi:hypothetical protein
MQIARKTVSQVRACFFLNKAKYVPA